MAMMEAGAIQLWALRASENQYPNMVQADHVRRSMGVTSQSMLVLRSACQTADLGDGCRRTYQAPGSANDVSGRGRTHPALVVLDLRSALMAEILLDMVGQQLRKLGDGTLE